MQKVKIGELKSRLSYYLRLVKSGQAVQVLERNTPIATIVPLPSGTVNEGLIKLRRQGILAGPGVKPKPSPAPVQGRAHSRELSELVVEERESGL